MVRRSGGARFPHPRKRSLAFVVAGLAAACLFPALPGADPTAAPDVTVSAATNVKGSSATLNGTVNAHDADGPNGASYTFSWGTTQSYSDGSVDGSVGPGEGAQDVHLDLTGLSENTPYYFQLCASNSASAGTPTCATGQFHTLGKPDVTTGSAAPGRTTAILHGTVDPNGAATTWMFKYRTGGGSYTSSPGGSVSAGSGATNVTETIPNLSPSTTYYYVLCGSNSIGDICDSPEQTFTTSDLPSATTDGATSVTPTSALVAGTVNPHGDSTTYAFEYGTSPGSYPSSAGGSAGAGTSDVSVSKTLSPLTGATTYYYRLCATNSSGKVCGDPQSFATPAKPTAVTGSATSVTTSSATLAGTVNPNGDSTSVFFEYGQTTSYGPTWPASPSPVNGRAPVSVSATLTGLSASTTFHYRLCASNTWGSHECGADRTFTTNRPPIAVLTANNNKTSGPRPLSVSFNGSQSSDPDGSIISWTLDFGDNSPFASGGSVLPTALTHQYTGVGSYTATLTVTDNQGATNSAFVSITVNTNLPPVPSLVTKPSPAKGTTPFDVKFDGSASTDPDDPIATWRLDFGDGKPAVSGNGTPPDSTSALMAHQYTVPGTTQVIYTATLTLTDEGGVQASTTKTITVDPKPTVSVTAPSPFLEGSGSKIVNFRVQLSAVSTHDITVDFATANGTATSTANGATPADYTATSGTFPIKAGTCGPTDPPCNIPVEILGDRINEPDETFSLVLSNPVNVTIDQGVATTTILNDDLPPEVIIDGAAALPSRTAHTMMGFTVHLCDPSDQTQCVPTSTGKPVTVLYHTDPAFSSAVAGVDYVPVQLGQVNIAPGEQTGLATVDLYPETHFQDIKKVAVLLENTLYGSQTTNATVRPGVINSLGLGAILNDFAANPASIHVTGASSITPTSATVSATVNPQGLASTAYVQYGKTDSYGFWLPAIPPANGVPAGGADFTEHPVSFSLTGLSPGTTYHYRFFAAHSQFEMWPSIDSIFTTAPAVVSTTTTTTPSTPPPPPTQPPPPPSPGPPPVRPTALNVTIRTTSVRTTKTGAFSLALACSGNAAPFCRGTLSIDDSKGANLTHRTFKITAGKRETLPVRLGSKALKLLLKKKKLTVDATVGYDDGLGGYDTNASSVKLLAPVQPQKKKAAPKKSTHK